MDSSQAASLNELLQGLMATDNALRASAEQNLDQVWRSKDSIGTLLLYLAEVSTKGPSDTVRSFSAVLLRRLAIRTPKELLSISDRTIGTLDEKLRSIIRSTVLAGYMGVQSPQVRRKLSDVISELAKRDASPAGSWSDLMPSIKHALSDKDPSFRETSFRILSTNPSLIETDLLSEYFGVFRAGFADDDDEVRIAACTAFVSYFRDSSKNEWQILLHMLPDLLNSLPKFLENGQDLALASVLESLMDLVEIAPKIFKNMFPTMVEFCSTVIKNTDQDSATRLAALELLTTFAEVSPVMCKQTPSYTSTMVLVNLTLLTEISIDDEEASEWNNDGGLDEGEDEVEYDAARQSLDRVSLKLGGQALAPPLFQFLPSMLQSENWREVFAALMALSSAAEGCVDVLTAEIPRLLDMVLPTLNHRHSRVQYACCNALGQMCTDFADIIQRVAGDLILPALISKLDGKSVPRVQAHAAAALVNFSEAASNDVLEPYLDDLLSALLQLLQSPFRYVQEQVLTTIAIIADAAEHKFKKYHQTLLPLLIQFLKSLMGPNERILTGKCVECSTLIALAVGPDNFAPYSDELIQEMGQLQESITADDDPVKPYLELGWTRICKAIGKRFLAYLPAVLPSLLTAAKAAQDISLLEEEEAEDFNNNDEWDVISLSGKLIAVHTAALDEKVTALDSLRIYANQLRGDFHPWINEVAFSIAIPALDFYLHDGVRGSASLLLAALLKCTILATSPDSVETITIWSHICNKLVDVLKNEPVPELIVTYYSLMVECVHTLAPSALSGEQLHQISSRLRGTLEEVYERIKQRALEDDEYTEDVDESEEEITDEELLDEVNKVVSSLFKKSTADFLPEFLDQIAPVATIFFNEDNINVKLCGVCLICDALESCGPQFDGKKYLNFIVSEFLTAPEASIRAAAAYAIGLAAQHGGTQYEKICSSALPTLFKVSTFPDARAEENLSATESCIASIAKICRFMGSSIDNLDRVLGEWISILPVIQDQDSALFAYGFLVHLIEVNHVAIMSNIAKVIDAIIQALSHKVVKGPLAEKLVESAKNIVASLPREDLASLLQAFPQIRDLIQ